MYVAIGHSRILIHDEGSLVGYQNSDNEENGKLGGGRVVL